MLQRFPTNAVLQLIGLQEEFLRRTERTSWTSFNHRSHCEGSLPSKGRNHFLAVTTVLKRKLISKEDSAIACVHSVWPELLVPVRPWHGAAPLPSHRQQLCHNSPVICKHKCKLALAAGMPTHCAGMFAKHLLQTGVRVSWPRYFRPEGIWLQPCLIPCTSQLSPCCTRDQLVPRSLK